MDERAEQMSRFAAFCAYNLETIVATGKPFEENDIAS
jgi:hypothetical protein